MEQGCNAEERKAEREVTMQKRNNVVSRGEKKSFNEILIFKGLKNSPCWDCKRLESFRISTSKPFCMSLADRKQPHTVTRPTGEEKKEDKTQVKRKKKKE